MFRTVIVDDDQDAIDYLKYVSELREELEIVGEALNVNEAISVIGKTQPDLLLLDVQMPGKDGFDLLEALPKTNSNYQVIFTTGHSEYAIQAIRHSAFDFLLKPVQKDEFNAAIDRLQNSQNPFSQPNSQQIQHLLSHLHTKPKLRLNTRNGFIQIPLDEIIYCEADSNYTVIHRDNNTREISSINLGEIEKMIAHPSFVRAGRSHLFNSDKILQVDTRENKIHFSTIRNGEVVREMKGGVVGRMRGMG